MITTCNKSEQEKKVPDTNENSPVGGPGECCVTQVTRRLHLIRKKLG